MWETQRILAVCALALLVAVTLTWATEYRCRSKAHQSGVCLSECGVDFALDASWKACPPSTHCCVEKTLTPGDLKEMEATLTVAEAQSLKRDLSMRGGTGGGRTRMPPKKNQPARPAPAKPAVTNSLNSNNKQRGQFKFAIHGNWCGPNWSGGKSGRAGPADEIDRACMVHDHCYNTKGYNQCSCDKGLLRDLNAAIPRVSSLAARAKARVIHFWFQRFLCNSDGQNKTSTELAKDTLKLWGKKVVDRLKKRLPQPVRTAGRNVLNAGRKMVEAVRNPRQAFTNLRTSATTRFNELRTKASETLSSWRKKIFGRKRALR